MNDTPTSEPERLLDELIRASLEKLGNEYGGNIGAMMTDIRRMREPSQAATTSEPAKHPGDFSAHPTSAVSHNGEIRFGISGLTARQHAAIELRVPDSGLDWLDAMIRESRRMDFAGQAPAGLMVGYYNHPNDADVCAGIAFKAAGDMLAAWPQKTVPKTKPETQEP